MWTDTQAIVIRQAWWVLQKLDAVLGRQVLLVRTTFEEVIERADKYIQSFFDQMNKAVG